MGETFCCCKPWVVVTWGCPQQTMLLSGGLLRGDIWWADLPAHCTHSCRTTAGLIVINKHSNLTLQFHCKSSPYLLCSSQRRRWLLAKQLFKDVFQTGAYGAIFWEREGEVRPEEAIAAEPVLGHVDFAVVCIPGGSHPMAGDRLHQHRASVWFSLTIFVKVEKQTSRKSFHWFLVLLAFFPKPQI